MATTAKRRPRPALNTVSLERALSKLGLASRSQAHTLIREGRVRVSGEVVLNPAARIVPECVAITIDGAAQEKSARLTIVLHKPRGVVTTRSDPEGRQTVYDLLADLPERVVPVGRLDLATSGLLLLTNDTQFGNWLTDPHSAVARVYLATVNGRATADVAARLQAGVVVDGERLRAAAATVRKASMRESHLVLTLVQGKNREVRRLLAAVGHPVTQLRRVQFGGVELGTLPPGQWRRLSTEELRVAFPGYQPRRRAPKPK
ncbi:MAG: pseudouridine synthase [Vicinamibacterales bacterium]